MEENDTPNSVLIVVQKGNKILVVERSKTDQWMPLHWSYPGGHIQKGETPYYAAKRELEEETGIKAKTVVYSGIRDTTSGKMYIYLCDEFDGDVKLNFVDQTGREVYIVMEQYLPKGTFSYTANLSNLNDGIYYTTLKTQINTISNKTILKK